MNVLLQHPVLILFIYVVHNYYNAQEPSDYTSHRDYVLLHVMYIISTVMYMCYDRTSISSEPQLS